MTGGFLWQLGKFGSDAVMAFFVLSGFVIAFCAEHKHKSFTEYMVARFARLWSVALPAIAITFVLDTTAGIINPSAELSSWNTEFTFQSIFASALFVNQIWFLELVPGTNAPFWSIGYEFIYYVLFALAYYMRGAKRIILLALGIVVAGPKILLLFPIWLLGALAYKATKLKIMPAIGWGTWVFSLLAIMIYYYFDARGFLKSLVPAGKILDNGVFSNSDILAKYLFAIIIFINIISFNIISSTFANLLNKNKHYIKSAAKYSFSLYLYHFPILMFFKVIHMDSIGQWWQIAIMYIGTLGGVYILAIYTEPRKDDIAKFLNNLVNTWTLRRKSCVTNQAIK